MNSKQIIMHPFEYDNAQFFGVPVYVYQQGEKIDYGRITKHTENCVYLNDGYYIKEVCTFVVA